MVRPITRHQPTSQREQLNQNPFKAAVLILGKVKDNVDFQFD